MKGYLLARLLVDHRVPILVVTPEARQRDLVYEDLRCLLAGWRVSEAGTTREWVCRYDPYPAAPPADGQRSRALTTYQPLWRLQTAEPVIVLAAAVALPYGVVPPAVLQERLLVVRVGLALPPHRLAAALVERGYRRVPLVEIEGDFALRGSILDLFVPGHTYPLRLEYFGDEIESLRAFATDTQTSVASLTQAVIAPMQPLSRQQLEAAPGFGRLRQYLGRHGWHESEVAGTLEGWQGQSPVTWPAGLEGFFYDRLASLLSYVPEAGLLCCVDMEDVLSLLQQPSPAATLRLGGAELPFPSAHLLPVDTLRQQLQERADVVFQQYDGPLTRTPITVLRSGGVPQFFGALERFITQVRQWQAEGFCILILCRFPLGVQRMRDLLAAYELGSQPLAGCVACLPHATHEPGSILLGIGQLGQGWVFPEVGLVVLREIDIFGAKKPEPPSSRSRPRTHDFADLRPGDLVVHIDYGVGLYRGMTFLEMGRERGEFMEIEYAEGAKLYVPSYRLSMIQKYSGGERDGVALERLGGTTWVRTKERVKASLLAMAKDVVQVHAARQLTPGHSYSPPGALHQEFDSGFEYTETEDQLRAIQEVMADLERPRPMERLVCGDVGYGKTEVALRAAFKVVYDGKQVAVLVPTTVLAQQHYDTFQRRFASYGVRVEMLSRLRSRREQQRILDGLGAGTVDIVIGTHRLLQRDLRYKDLGLLVVDEEHRFGVVHKEQIKRLSARLDVLMLTATPIPRSLHMTMVDLRDCSLIETPPEGRLAIQTFVLPFTPETIQHAIRQELARGGQVFFVHNRVEALPGLQAWLAQLVPECRVGIAHGQMRERHLETIMLRFLERRFDLLLCTTIIESGLDIPSVNTVLINHADQFGLAQLYQLRGRVGRGIHQAYAYLLIPGDTVLSEGARQRIDALVEFSDLGSGFRLAARDLGIRGAGNLLGPQQSGHIASVGFDLYRQLLAEAIGTVRGEALPVHIEPELRLQTQGYIPETYVESEPQRLELYRRLAAVADAAALQALCTEVGDRFGKLPEALQRLVAVVEIKLLARQLAIERLEHRGQELYLTFHPQTAMVPARLLEWLHNTAPGFRFHSELVVAIPWPEQAPGRYLELIKKRLQLLLTSGSM